MQDKIRENFNLVTVGLFLVQVAFMIFIAIAFTSVLGEDRVDLGVAVSDLQQEITGLPENSKKDIEYQIYQVVANNSAANSIQESGVVIREGSLINDYYDDINVHYVSFIADVPEVKQSYRVFHEWSNDAKNEYVSPNGATGVVCLDNDELIYGEFKCDRSNDYFKKAIAYRMIYALGYMAPGNSLRVVMVPESYPSSPDFKVKVFYRECVTMCMCVKVSESEKNKALAEFNKLMVSLGLDPNDIPHYFDSCDDDEFEYSEAGL